MSRNAPAFETSTREALDWRDRAACLSEDPELFFANPTETQKITEAKQVCWSCEVRRECGDFAESTRQDVGVWAGLSEEERRSLRRARARRSRGAL